MIAVTKRTCRESSPARDAVVVMFVNFVGYQAGCDVALQTGDLRAEAAE